MLAYWFYVRYVAVLYDFFFWEKVILIITLVFIQKVKKLSRWMKKIFQRKPKKGQSKTFYMCNWSLVTITKLKRSPPSGQGYFILYTEQGKEARLFLVKNRPWDQRWKISTAKIPTSVIILPKASMSLFSLAFSLFFILGFPDKK